MNVIDKLISSSIYFARLIQKTCIIWLTYEHMVITPLRLVLSKKRTAVCHAKHHMNVINDAMQKYLE